MKKIVVLVGSNRRESINLKFARALGRLASGRLEFDFADLSALPMYNDDDLAQPPAAVRALKEKVAAADGVLFVTPEYNRSIPALLKNAIDWVSRPYGDNDWAGKAAAIVGTSPGVIGTATAQMHLRTIMISLGGTLMGQPEVFLQYKEGLFDNENAVTDEGTEMFLNGFIDRFVGWVDVAQERVAA
ncbi:NADPH-dependent FMN reductase [Nitratireductor pacificus]|uniref:Chromate reductase n=1 Tax=Nitratireductor pacificus pht-3B TaxID=391937 RepID=K2MJB1_9HYPH|nr:NADPH-dependent FMN reductase [Nitratireductor pacificus]EKF17242.1 chromate reductase [Nitratireductor pacificus pht-3B]